MSVNGKKLIIPPHYEPKLSIMETEAAIKKIKDFFEDELSRELNLMRISAPLFVKPETGINDNLNGIERPVTFEVKDIGDNPVEVVQSLAKWKRMALKKYGFKVNEGLYTDMNAIRKDEELDNLHSVYVDQWDWELIIRKEDRNLETLKKVVGRIYKAIKNTEDYVCSIYPCISPKLPEEISYITTQKLEDMYPDLSPRERENMICREKKAVFVMQIGGCLKSGKKHDGRAPDYDDWELNGDILFWYPMLETALEISSMGIRVDEHSLVKQLEISGCMERLNMQFHRELMEGGLPYTIGGGIGQSRLCMFLTDKAHIGEVQASVWPDEMVDLCEAANIHLL